MKISRKTRYPVSFPTTPKKLTATKLTPVKAIELSVKKWEWMLNNVNNQEDAAICDDNMVVSSDTCALCKFYDDSSQKSHWMACTDCPLRRETEGKVYDCCNEFHSADIALTAYAFGLVGKPVWRKECGAMIGRLREELRKLVDPARISWS